MIILDTCALIFDALTPDKLSLAAEKAIISAEKKNCLFCCDISLWEVAMLIQKKRLVPGTDAQTFLQLTLQARQIQILNISLEIAVLSTTHPSFNHFDPQIDLFLQQQFIIMQNWLLVISDYVRCLSFQLYGDVVGG